MQNLVKNTNDYNEYTISYVNKEFHQVIGTEGGDSSGNNRVRRSSDKLEAFIN